jgi:hypothetical protein
VAKLPAAASHGPVGSGQPTDYRRL